MLSQLASFWNAYIVGEGRWEEHWLSKSGGTPKKEGFQKNAGYKTYHYSIMIYRI